jgi:uncharacterized protein (DUF342 family)
MIPLNILAYLKIAGVVVALGGLTFAGYKVYNYHLNAIEQAVNTVKLELAVEAQQAVEKREKELTEKARQERELIETELAKERRKVSDLQRMLLIEHDLDRLLQRKPGLILPRVNNGTEEYFKELEEATR